MTFEHGGESLPGEQAFERRTCQGNRSQVVERAPYSAPPVRFGRLGSVLDEADASVLVIAMLQLLVPGAAACWINSCKALATLKLPIRR